MYKIVHLYGKFVEVEPDTTTIYPQQLLYTPRFSIQKESKHFHIDTDHEWTKQGEGKYICASIKVDYMPH